jgi:transposase-like protein
MITEEIVYKCNKCGSENIVKNGINGKGKQKYHCKECKSYGVLNPYRGHSEELKEQIMKAYFEKSSLRGLERIYKVSRITITKWIKKSGKFAKDK